MISVTIFFCVSCPEKKVHRQHKTKKIRDNCRNKMIIVKNVILAISSVVYTVHNTGLEHIPPEGFPLCRFGGAQ